MKRLGSSAGVIPARQLVAPAGSYRSGGGGDEAVEAFETAGRLRRLGHQIEEALLPFAEVVRRVMTVPGVDQRIAEMVLAEIGLEMDRFPTAGHLSSWAGLACGNHESAGKRQSGRTTPGNRWLKTALVQAAWAAARARGTHLSGKFHRIARRRGGKRAAVAVGHTILVIIDHLVKEGTNYREITGEANVA